MKDEYLLVLLFLIPCSGVRGESVTPRREASIEPEDVPADEVAGRMRRWREIYSEEMAPVRKEWSRVVWAIHRGLATDLPILCPEFRSRVSALDRQRLLSVADPFVKRNLDRGLALLDDAATYCRQDRYFALAFRLYKARHVILAVDRQVEKYR